MGSRCVELYRFELGGAALSKLDGLKALWRRNTRGGHFEVTVIENMEYLTILLKYCVSSFSIPDEILISVIL